jgi:hypothetical protein
MEEVRAGLVEASAALVTDPTTPLADVKLDVLEARVDGAAPVCPGGEGFCRVSEDPGGADA